MAWTRPVNKISSSAYKPLVQLSAGGAVWAESGDGDGFRTDCSGVKLNDAGRHDSF